MAVLALCELRGTACNARVTFAYDIFPDRQGIHLRYSGTFTQAGLEATALVLWGDARYSRDYHGIVDCRQGPVSTTTSNLRGLIEFVQRNPYTSRGRWAAVTTEPLPTALALVYGQAMGKFHPFGVFSSWRAACEFVGVEFDPHASLNTVPKLV